MAQAAPLIGTLFSVIGGLRESKAQERAAEQQAAAAQEAQRISNMNAARIEAETAETARREREAASEAQSQRKLIAAASGGTMGGSTGAYLETQAQREREYVDWLEKAGASRASITRAEGGLTRMEGDIRAQATRDRASASKWGAIGEGAGALFKLYGGS